MDDPHPSTSLESADNTAHALTLSTDLWFPRHVTTSPSIATFVARDQVTRTPREAPLEPRSQRQQLRPQYLTGSECNLSTLNFWP
jgi:hypothetical protein